MANIKIEGKEYDIDSLPQEVKSQLAALQQCDQKINSWNMDIAIAQTARAAYAAEVNLLLEQVAVVGAEKVEVEVVEVVEVEVVVVVEVISYTHAHDVLKHCVALRMPLCFFDPTAMSCNQNSQQQQNTCVPGLSM